MKTQRSLFHAVQIENFRGFRDLQRIELNASAVLVVGPNGTGKTSFFDALQWLLTGDIPRLRDRAGRRKAEYVVNQWSTTGVAEVTAEMLIGERNVQVRRRGTSAESIVEVYEEHSASSGASAERRLASLLLTQDGITLEEALPATGLLQQDVLRSVNDGEPTKRYEQLTRLLGLEELPSFEEATRSRADALRREATKLRTALDQQEAELRDVEGHLQRLSAQFLATPSIQEFSQELMSRLEFSAAALEVIGGIPTDATDLSRLGNAARRIRDESAELISIGRQFSVETLSDESLARDLALAIEAAVELGHDLQVSEEALSAASKHLVGHAAISW